MYTYTTPTITCTLEGVDFSLVNYVRIAIGEGKKVIVRVVEPSDFSEDTATIKLTQEETAELGGGEWSRFRQECCILMELCKLRTECRNRGWKDIHLSRCSVFRNEH